MQGVIGSETVIAPAVIADAAGGDALALERIIRRHHDEMVGVCTVICGGDADLAQDAVQAAWPIAWRKLGSLRDPDRLRPWLVSIAANEARQVLRRRRIQRVAEIRALDVDPGSPDPSGRVALTDLGAALRRLGPDDRALLALRYVSEFDSVEIGRILGISASGARSRLERLLDRLRKELDGG
jgi:RNA polymerase sigma-70 factor, ECF subfamily